MLTREHGLSLVALFQRRWQTLSAAPAAWMLLLCVTALALVAAFLLGMPLPTMACVALLVAGVGSLTTGALRAQTPLTLPDTERPIVEQQLMSELQELRRAQRWQRAAVLLAGCDSPQELQRCATAQAATIWGAMRWGDPAQPDVQESRCSTPSPAQEAGLALLDTIVTLRTELLSSQREQQQQQQALMALWQIVGLAQLPAPPGVDLLRAPCAQVASALRLDWIAIMAPDAARPVTPVLIASGSATSELALHPAYLRVAAEALRSERTLVRNEEQRVVTCMPIMRRDRAPLVIVARGAQIDDLRQTTLLLLGDLLARCLDIPAAQGA